MVTGVSSKLRLGGLSSGLDTDSLVQQLMRAERIPLDKLMQKKTMLEWKRDNYRDVTNKLRSFKDSFFDVLKSGSNLTSPSAYKKFTVTSSSTAVTATATSDATASSHTIDSITTLAKAATAASAGSVSGPLQGTAASDTNFTTGNSLNITLDGVAKQISIQGIDYGAGNYAAIQTDLQNAIDNSFGKDGLGNSKITVNQVGGVFSFTPFQSTSKVTLTNASANNALDKLKFASGASNRINLYDKLDKVSLNNALSFKTEADGKDYLEFKINNIDFSFEKTSTSLKDIMNSVNSSAAGVEMRYSELDDKFTFTAKQKGTGAAITIQNNGGNLFGGITNGPSAINLAFDAGTDNTVISGGQDAVFELDGQTLTRSDNSFTVDGISYTLNADGIAAPITIGVTQDVNGIFDNIKGFVDKYNDVVGFINGELSEEKYRQYSPLTDEQKASMKEEDITKWEEKAKSGLLKNDSILQKIVTDMRKALSDSISGISGSLSEIGITTGNWYDKGKLNIDETKLKDAIRNNPDKVENLFSKKSTIDYSPDITATDRSTRYSESGLANRISDIIQDNIRTIRDKNSKKGILLEKAGLTGDITEFINDMNREIDSSNKSINDLNNKLISKENNYYKRFTALEKAMSKMNSQGQWLSQQLGGGQ